MRLNAPQFEMGLGLPPVAAKAAPVARAKRVVEINKPVRYHELPDEIRLQMWLRDAAWMSEVLS